jgi:hypothetical protein
VFFFRTAIIALSEPVCSHYGYPNPLITAMPSSAVCFPSDAVKLTGTPTKSKFGLILYFLYQGHSFYNETSRTLVRPSRCCVTLLLRRSTIVSLLQVRATIAKDHTQCRTDPDYQSAEEKVINSWFLGQLLLQPPNLSGDIDGLDYPYSGIISVFVSIL